MAQAKQLLNSDSQGDVVVKDSNGTILNEGDAVTVINDLKVKGGSWPEARRPDQEDPSDWRSREHRVQSERKHPRSENHVLEENLILALRLFNPSTIYTWSRFRKDLGHVFFHLHTLFYSGIPVPRN